jgi:hypothetical protein
MTLRCRNCSRVNPPEARYCYHDGAVLEGHQSGPIAVSAQPFLSPFFFPSGRQCRNFDELVLACDSEWESARDLLRQGYLESFLAGIGRADLAKTARQCARATDPDRGLDELLNKLPCSNREPARLFAQPLEVNLGQISRSGDRRFVLHLENQGSGLLFGSVATDNTDWLALGDGAGSPRKVFQCLHDFSLPVQVHGKCLRAGNKPLEGRLTIESNGGTQTVLVRAEVPVQPFSEGVLAGARSPRQVAEKAKANPKGAAGLFEKGAVAAWYESNGWTYPVQGPASSGLGAVQQFFEALGLVTPPKVDISDRAIHLTGMPGSSVEQVVQVQAQERRPVYAHATTNTPWLQIGRIVLDGRTARIPIRVPVVPARPGEQLDGKVQVTGNGNQRFVVDVTLSIIGVEPAGRASPRVAVRVDRLPHDAVLDMRDVLAAVPVLSAADVVTDAPTVELVADTTPGRDGILDVLPAEADDTRKRQRKPRPRDEEWEEDEPAGFFARTGRHLIPLGVLALLLLVPIVHDLLLAVLPGESAGKDPELSDTNPVVSLRFHDGPKDANDRTTEGSMRFGLVMLGERDPTGKSRYKRLTYDEWGRSNNTCLKVDGIDSLFGEPPGTWVDRERKLPATSSGRVPDGLVSVWRLPGPKIEVTQTAEIVPGEQSHRLDTCLVRYTIENQDSRPHAVGIRFLLDTFIGANDGVPFTIPGALGLCDTQMRFDTPSAVPDFIQALEKDDLRNPGTVAYLQFRLGTQIESPGRVLLGAWPDERLARLGYPLAQQQYTLWEVPYLSMKELDNQARRVGGHAAFDSAVTMYWDPRPLPAGGKREVGFTYGLGQVVSGEGGGRLALSVGGRLVRNGEFTLTALVHNPEPREKLTLSLPNGLRLANGDLEQEVPAVPTDAARPDSPVTWHIRAGNDGPYELTVRSSKGATQKLRLTIRTRGVFD